MLYFPLWKAPLKRSCWGGEVGVSAPIPPSFLVSWRFLLSWGFHTRLFKMLLKMFALPQMFTGSTKSRNPTCVALANFSPQEVKWQMIAFLKLRSKSCKFLVWLRNFIRVSGSLKHHKPARFALFGLPGLSFKVGGGVRTKQLSCPLEQNYYPSPDKVWERTRMFPVYFIEFGPAPLWEFKFF